MQRSRLKTDSTQHVKYLTPHKVGLLILIHVYCNGLIPPTNNAEIFTLLLDHIEKPFEQDPEITSFKRLRFPTIHSKSVYELILQLARSLDNFNQFHSFIMNTSSYLATRSQSTVDFKVTRPLLVSSFLARFVRKCRLEYVKLDFSGQDLLWRLYKSYRGPSSSLPIDRAPVDDTPDLHYWPDSETRRELCIAREDIEKLCHFEINRMEKYTEDNKSDDLLSERLNLITSSCNPVSALFLKFKQALRSGDYFSATGYIHAYFDHTITTQLSETPSYPFALLHLAILHDQFNNSQDAGWTIREAISTARETKDTSTLLFSLSWLHQFSNRKTMSISKDESLTYLKLKTKEANLHSLLPIINLIEAGQLLRTGASLISVFENMIQTSYTNNVLKLEGNMTSQLSFQSSLWNRLGNQTLSTLYTQVLLKSYRFEGMMDQIIREKCMEAIQILRQGDINGCFLEFERMNKIVKYDFMARKIIEFYRSTAELWLSVNQKQVQEAQSKLEKMKALELTDGDASMHVLIGIIDVSILQGSAESSLSLIREKFQKLQDEEGDIVERLILIFLQARLLVKLGNPAKALSMLLRCVDLSEKYHARLIYFGAVRLLASVMNQLGQFKEAYRILSAIMPFILETKDCYLQATSYLTLAESLLGQKKYSVVALNFIESARDGFRAIKDVEGESSCLEKLSLLQSTERERIVAQVFAFQEGNWSSKG